MQFSITDKIQEAFPIRKTILETVLYSVYLVPAAEGSQEGDDILLIEHPPAQEPTTCIWSNKNLLKLTKTEMIREITDFIHDRTSQDHKKN
ncbi:MAG TPA: hypothetical protein VK947_07945 [Planococcus sp. (in: firmicutes)]|nr:hypothetical protein [Planococcus sp. (in: firmicutes)]